MTTSKGFIVWETNYCRGGARPVYVRSLPCRDAFGNMGDVEWTYRRELARVFPTPRAAARIANGGTRRNIQDAL